MRSIVRLLSGIIVGALLMGCSTEQPAGTPSPSVAKPEAPAAPAYKPDSQGMFGGTLDLLPVDAGGDMEAVIANLKKNFATDRDAGALLSRLHGGMAVKLEVIEPDRQTPRGQESQETEDQPDRWMTPPPPGFPVLVRIAFDRMESQSVTNGKKSASRLVGVTVGGVVLIKFPTKPADKPGRIAGVDGIDAVLLAVNDYLLRTNSGFLLFQHGKLFPVKLHEQHGKNLDKYRTYLDSNVERQAKVFRDYWNARGADLK